MTIFYTDSFNNGKGESRRLLAEAIAAYLGLAQKEKTEASEGNRAAASELVRNIRTGEQGKPFIEGFDPFSVSHTGSIWAVLIADRECGLDIQLEKNSRMQPIANRIFDPKDAELVEAAFAENNETGRKVFFQIWTRREALVKAAGATVHESSIAAVGSKDLTHVTAYDREYTIWDIEIPGIEKLHAAVCVEGTVCSSEPIAYHTISSTKKD
ncbi:MAG: 4'-phosphopantetheinyl transferase superfamily protein [Mogibacterium sp.]|nr:4'-phosphopantetheinyl transferase superfamily protein [Mogibacterium sp.]